MADTPFDAVDTQSDHAARIARIENQFPQDPDAGARVRFYHEFILQWLYRGSGSAHPVQGTKAGGEWLYQAELRGTGLNAELRNRIRDLRAEVGVAPHLIRKRDTDGLWISQGAGFGISDMLLPQNIGVDGGLEGVNLLPEAGYGSVPTEFGTQPETWIYVHLVQTTDHRGVVWVIKIPAGQALPPGGNPDGGTLYGCRWSGQLSRQIYATDNENFAGGAYNPWGSSYQDVAHGSREVVEDELGDGSWGFNLSWHYIAFPDGSTAEPGDHDPYDKWEPGGPPSFSFAGRWAPPFNSMKHLVQTVDGYHYAKDNHTKVYAWISEVNPAFETIVIGDWYQGIEDDLQDEYMNHATWHDPENLEPFLDSYGAPMPALAVVQDLFETYLPLYADVYEWCLQRFQEWQSGNSVRTHRREQLWEDIAVGANWEGNAQLLRRDGWIYLRGKVAWSGTLMVVPIPWTDDDEIWTGYSERDDDPEVRLDAPANALTGLYGLAYGGSEPAAPIRLRFDSQVIGAGVVAMILRPDDQDFSDRKGISLDGVAWQHVDPGNE